MMKTRWIALIALPLLAACARGGEEDAGAALTDTTSAATLTGDTAMAAPAPADTAMAAPMDSAHMGHTMDSTTVPADSAAHP